MPAPPTPPALESLRLLAQRPLGALRATKRRFMAAADAVCSSSGSEIDADVLLAAYQDAETAAVQQRYIALHRG